MKSETTPTSSRFATVYGSPGQSPRTLGALRVFWPLAPICLAAGYLLRAALPKPSISTTQAGFLFLALSGALAFFIAWSAKRLQSFLKGAEGEEAVARALAHLPAGQSVFNDLLLTDNTNCDHVVAAPSGIFVIETKNWSGDITFENGQVVCNGKKPSRPPLKQVKEAAASLMEHLSNTGCPTDVPVHPVLCFVGATLPSEPSNINGVRICTETGLHALFENTLEAPLPAGTLNLICDELKNCLS